MLELRDIHFSYPDQKTVLEGISLKLKKGQVFGLVGESGGGKSTLLKIVAGFLDPSIGVVYWKGEKVKGPSLKLIPGHKDIQLVNQDFQLDNFHTVKENVLLQILDLPEKERIQFADELLELMELQSSADKQARYLSGGEQQRLSIARALAKETEVLLLDEPFSHLDAHLRIKIGSYIKELIRIRKTICILVSHEGAEVMQWCSQIAFLNEGKIQRIDTPEQFYYHPSDFYQGSFFGELNEVRIDKERILFRPTEYKMVKTGGLELKFYDSIFAGTVWKSFFKTNKKESVILYSNKPLQKLKYIEIKRKNSKT